MVTAQPFALHVENLSYAYGDAVAIEGVSLAVGSREIVAVIGPSGCGKTTLLRSCAGLTPPLSGSLVRATERLGFVFQEPALFPWRRVAANAAFLAHNTDRDHVDHLLEASGLAPDKDKFPYQLSGGMRMRLSLVRTLAARPSLVMLDEPFGALDQITRYALHDHLSGLHESEGFAALLVTHSVDEAVYLADRVLVMSRTPGRIVGDVTVPFSRQRTGDLRYSADFASLCGEISSCLRRYAS